MPLLNARLNRLISVVIVILILFSVILSGLTNYSLRTDEALNSWLIDDTLRSPDGIRETLRFVRDSLVNTLNRANESDIFPIYPLLLDVWSLVTGQSELSLRFPSTLLAVIALTAIYAIVRDWLKWRIGLIVLILIGTTGFFLTVARTTTSTSLYLVILTLLIWIISRWWHPHGTSNLILNIATHQRLAIGITIMIAIVQLIIYPFIWQATPDWRSVINSVDEMRLLNEPVIIIHDERTPFAYYTDRLEGITMNLGWRDFTVQEIQSIGEHLADIPVIWVILDMQNPSNEDVLAILSATRIIRYSENIDGSSLYRLDQAAD